MNYLKHIMIFIFAFQVEIKVRATEGEQQHEVNAMAQSENLSGSNKGAIFATSDSIHIDEENVEVFLGKGSSMVRNGQKSFTLISGYLWVKKGSHLNVNTPYGIVKAKRGDFWVFAEKDQYRLRNIDSEITIVLKDGVQYELPEGFEVWFGGVDSRGHSSKGMVEPINITQHLKYWNVFYNGTKEEFVKDVQRLKSKWKGIADTSSDLYLKVVERHLDSIEDQKQKKKKKEQDEVIQQKNLKNRFFETTFSK